MVSAACVYQAIFSNAGLQSAVVDSARRTLIGGAAGALFLSKLRAAPRREPHGPLVWRAAGQNMRQTVSGFSGGSAWSQCTRTRHYSNVPFRYARFVIATFHNIGKPIADADLPASFNFQIGVEYPFNAAFAGIAPRAAVAFNGRNTASYVGGVGPFGYILSDIFDFGTTIPAGAFFGLWTTIENAAGAGAGHGAIPGQATLSNNYQPGWQRYTGSVSAISSLLSAATALSATSITPTTSAQGGGGWGLSPCMMLIQCPASYPSIFGIGDSIMYGVGEGDPGSGPHGDSLGSALGNAGFAARWIYEVLGYNFVNLGRGSDAFGKFTAETAKYRLKLLALANPTHILSQNSHNDISGPTKLPVIVASAQAAYAAMRAAAPGVPIVQACCTPNSSSSDNWASTANQTATAFRWGDSSSIRGMFNNSYVRAAHSPLGNDGFIDPNAAMEYGYQEGAPASETSLWNVTGQPDGWTRDGTHPNSFGHMSAAAAMVAYRGGIERVDPFASDPSG
jgi:lysophospholipase L1-like esterase